MEKSIITWPEYKGKRLIKDGTIDSVPFKEVWKRCQRETRIWFKHKMKTNKAFNKLMSLK